MGAVALFLHNEIEGFKDFCSLHVLCCFIPPVFWHGEKYKIIFRIRPVRRDLASNLPMLSSYSEKATAIQGHLEFFLLSGACSQKA